MSDITSALSELTGRRPKFRPQATPVTTTADVAQPIAAPKPVMAPRAPQPVQRQSSIPARPRAYSSKMGEALQNFGQALGNFGVYRERRLAADTLDEIGKYQAELLQIGTVEEQRLYLDNIDREKLLESQIRAVDTLDGTLTALERAKETKTRLASGENPDAIRADLAVLSSKDLDDVSDEFRENYTNLLQKTVSDLTEVSRARHADKASDASQSILLQTLSAVGQDSLGNPNSDPDALQEFVNETLVQFGPGGDRQIGTFQDLDLLLIEAAEDAAMQGNIVFVDAILDAKRGDNPSLRHHAKHTDKVRTILAKTNSRANEIEKEINGQFSNQLDIAAANGDLAEFLKRHKTSMDELLAEGRISSADFRRLDEVNVKQEQVNFQIDNQQTFAAMRTLLAYGKARDGDLTNNVPPLSVESEFWLKAFSKEQILKLRAQDEKNERAQIDGNKTARTQEEKAIKTELLVNELAADFVASGESLLSIESQTITLSSGVNVTLPRNEVVQQVINRAIGMSMAETPDENRAQISRIIARSGETHDATKRQLSSAPTLLGTKELSNMSDVPPEFLSAFFQYESMVGYGYAEAAETHAGQAAFFYDHIKFLKDGPLAPGLGLENPDSLFSAIQLAHENFSEFGKTPRVINPSAEERENVLTEVDAAIRVVPGLFNDRAPIRNISAVGNWATDTAKQYLMSGVRTWDEATAMTANKARSVFTVRHGIAINKTQFPDIAANPERFDAYDKMIQDAWAEQIAPKVNVDPDDYNLALIPAGNLKNTLVIRNIAEDDVFDAYLLPGRKRALAFTVGVDENGVDVKEHIALGSRLSRADIKILERARVFSNLPSSGSERVPGTFERIVEYTNPELFNE